MELGWAVELGFILAGSATRAVKTSGGNTDVVADARDELKSTQRDFLSFLLAGVKNVF